MKNSVILKSEKKEFLKIIMMMEQLIYEMHYVLIENIEIWRKWKKEFSFLYMQYYYLKSV